MYMPPANYNSPRHSVVDQAISDWFKGNVKGESKLPNIAKASFWSPVKYKDDKGKDQSSEEFGVGFSVTPWGGDVGGKWFKFEAGAGLTHNKLNAEYGAALAISVGFTGLLGKFEGKVASAGAEITVASLGFSYANAGVVTVSYGEGSDIEISIAEGAVTNRRFLSTLTRAKVNEGMQMEAKNARLEAALTRVRTAVTGVQDDTTWVQTIQDIYA